MRYGVRAAFIAAGIAVVSAATPRAEQAAPSPEYRELQTPAGLVRSVRVSLDKFDVRVITPDMTEPHAQEVARASDPERSPRGLFLADYRQKYDLSVVVTGGYLASFSPPRPVGLVKSDGLLVSAVHENWQLDGIACFDKGLAAIDARERVEELEKKYPDCIQAGPLLLKDGKPPAEGARRAPEFDALARKVVEQTAVCIDGNNNVLLVVADKMTLDQMTAALQRPELGCVRALALNSGPMLVNDKTFGADEYLVPNVVGIKPR